MEHLRVVVLGASRQTALIMISYLTLLCLLRVSN